MAKSSDNFFTSKAAERFYPAFAVDYIKNPSRLYAFPILGIVVKFIILIPVFVELYVLGIIFGILLVVNSFVVLFTGAYWDTSYSFTLKLMRLGAKVWLFIFGLTNSYPGFSFDLPKEIKLDIKKPASPNRLFAIPVVGFVIRAILLIPYFIWEYVLQSASSLGVFISFVPVLFQGRYPETTFELARDYMRINLGAAVYMFGLSDTYPSFWIDMSQKHKTAKIILIVLGILAAASNLSGAFTPKTQYQYNPYQQQMQQYQQQMNNGGGTGAGGTGTNDNSAPSYPTQ